MVAVEFDVRHLLSASNYVANILVFSNKVLHSCAAGREATVEMAKASGRRIGGGGRINPSPAPRCSPQAPDRGETFNLGPEAVRCLGGAFGSGVAPGAGAGGADGADLEPVLCGAGQAGGGAARGFADVALCPGSAGRPGRLGDVGLDTAPVGIPEEVHGAFEGAADSDEVGGLRELADVPGSE